ncbi:sulfonate ABC transporter substrate-binding protein [Pseudomonas cichorii]|nr:sulfonate ABC transporter substrate-binding protein [Pseudomonas cichorii]MBX8490972.1 sulfonate ABC transporter substrate-binding protein [Pseudomonas cichorii]MBX8519982.1 sulfonate ABC transporter substrate-binding protein [Pseudomonas cichorii]MBX8549887.1 sulfonate ABC transporter substrate-binding protein [Pseudomonas cichorii]MBX8555296.1 sulfonate ABC transporter substrate-binding protein [Pseudomonas cichorii]MBX8583476.1 sulfonate ABC transporter substrate-binding protein [Pseudom
MKPLAFIAAVLTLCGVFNTAIAQEPDALRIGYQKGSITLVLAKEHGLLEKRFANTRIKWIEFPAGPQMLEALNIGSLDIASTGDIPPIFAQVAGADLVYIGAEPAKPQAETILVRNDSPLKGVADLKGRKVALQKGSSAHNLVLRALNKAGLSFKDIQPVYLTPADARAAFENGSVDAWAIWDPYYSIAINEGHSRVLANGEGLGLSGPIYTARRAYAESNRAFVQQVLDELSAADALTRSDRAESIQILVRSMGLPEAVIAQYIDHRPESPSLPITPEIIRAQQATADLFYENRLVPKRVDVQQAVLKGAVRE